MFLNFRVRLNNPFVEESDPDDYDVDVDDNVSNDENVEDDDDNVDNYLEFILTNDNFGMSRRLRSQGPGRKKRCLDNKRFFVFFLISKSAFVVFPSKIFGTCATSTTPTGLNKSKIF